MAVNQGSFKAVLIWVGVKMLQGWGREEGRQLCSLSTDKHQVLKRTFSTHITTLVPQSWQPWEAADFQSPFCRWASQGSENLTAVPKDKHWTAVDLQFKLFFSKLRFCLHQHYDLLTHACLEAKLIRLLLVCKLEIRENFWVERLPLRANTPISKVWKGLQRSSPTFLPFNGWE